MTLEHNIKHIAIILDGNRRWAKSKGLPKMVGHTEGAKNIKKVGLAVLEENIPYLTVWGLSTENLKNRSEDELKHLFSLFTKLIDYLEELIKNDVRLNLIGNIEGLPENTQKSLQEAVEKTKDNKKMTLTLALNYGGRDEIMRAMKKMINDKVSPDEIDEDKVKQYLDTHDLPEVDMVIRPGGHSRLSGWLPWQTTYSELYFTKVFWPAFNKKELRKAIEWFVEQQRNRGK